MDQRIIDLYNDYIHGDMPRRSFLRRVAEIAGGAAAAAALLPLVECSEAWGQQVDPKDERLMSGYESYAGTRSEVTAYVARPAGAKLPLPGVLVVHENRGLNAHIEDVARRAALAGYVAVAPDGLSYVGGSPRDQEAARDRFREADVDTITADVIRGVGYLKSRGDCTGRIGSVGFCYGGGVSLQCAVADPAADASVLFYGRALSAEQVARVKVPLMMHYAGNDPRVNAMIPEFRTALDAHGVAYSLHMYPGTGHGFHNDTSQARYDRPAAELAWQRTVSFFDHYLRGGVSYNSTNNDEIRRTT
jgi:carboxymethylenebutenolidase